MSCRFYGCTFDRVDLVNCLLVNCDFESCTFRSCGLSGSRFIDCTFGATANSIGSEFSIQAQACNFDHVQFVGHNKSLPIYSFQAVECSFRDSVFGNVLGVLFVVRDSNFEDAVILNSTFSEFDFITNSCRGLLVSNSELKRLHATGQKLVGVIGAHDIVLSSSIISDQSKPDDESYARTRQKLALEIEDIFVRVRQTNRIFERVNSVIISTALERVRAGDRETNHNQSPLDEILRREIDAASESATGLEVPEVNDLTLSARVLHAANLVTPHLLTPLATQAALALARGSPDLSSTAKCIHVMRLAARQCSLDTFSILLTHEETGAFSELLNALSLIRELSNTYEGRVRRIEVGSSRLLLEDFKAPTFAKILIVLLLLGIRLEYSTQVDGDKFRVSYDLSGRFNFWSDKTGVAIDLKRDPWAGNVVPDKEREEIQKRVEKWKDRRTPPLPIDRMSAHAYETPLDSLPVFRTLEQVASAPGLWSLTPRLERGIELELVAHSPPSL